MLDISHPKDIASRNILLQQALRPVDAIIPIESEYPTVLTGSNHDYSYCLYHDKEIIAHANLWPRKLVNKDSNVVSKIGLIGNVATKESWQGKGLMRSLLEDLIKKSLSYEMRALILWSDLKQFYHKLGFQPLGFEWRFLVCVPQTMSLSRYRLIDRTSLKDEDLETMLRLRPLLPYTLSRSLGEFKALLQIPYTHIFISRTNNKINGYAICGKGYDLNGVIHEWGFADDNDFPFACADICKALHINSCYVLVPNNCRKGQARPLAPYCLEQKRHAMCLANIFEDSEIKKHIKDSFIWGLDSI